MENLLQPARARHVLQITASGPLEGLAGELRAAFPALAFENPENRLLRIEADGPVPVGPLVRFLEERGVEVVEARRLRPCLEDVFAEITGLGAETLRQDTSKSGGRA